MRLPRVERTSPSRDAPTAHARFRAGARRRLHGCVALSAALHLVLFLAWPDLSPSTLDPGPPSAASPLELVSLDPLPPTEDELVALPLAAEEDEPAPERADEEEREAPGGAAGADASDGDGRAEALERIAGATARVLERRPVPPSEPNREEPADRQASDREQQDRDDVRIPGASTDLDERLSEEEMMRLERLAAVRPRLAFGSPSSWLVVENPGAVREFMRRRFPGVSEAGGGGTLSVSLWVDERGSVEWAEIDRSSGDPELDESALELFEEVVAFGPAQERRLDVPTAAVFWLSW